MNFLNAKLTLLPSSS